MGKPVEFHFDQRHPGELALLTVSGSHAYGLAHEASDLDLRGVYVAPGADLFKADLVREQVVLHDPDTTIFELRKFCKLAAAGNPGALEMLWTPPAQIVVASEAWAEMVAVRQAFLSVRVHEAFLSYARSQWEDASRLAAGEEMGGRWKERTRLKHLVHTFRVLEEAEMLFRTGEMKVRVDDAERLRRLAARPSEELAAVIRERIGVLAAIPTRFAERPDSAAIDRLLVKLRMEALERERQLGPQGWNLAEADYEGAGWPKPAVKDEGSEVSV